MHYIARISIMLLFISFNLWVVILDREWLDESSQVHWQQASAVPTTDCHDVQHAVTRDTDLQIEDAGEAIGKICMGEG
jgi:hypothetical protein